MPALSRSLRLPILPNAVRSVEQNLHVADNYYVVRHRDVFWKAAAEEPPEELFIVAAKQRLGLGVDASRSEANVLFYVIAMLAALSAAAVATRGGPSPPLGWCREVLAGGLAAAIGETIFFPIEVVKVRLQAATGKDRSQRSLVQEVRALFADFSFLAWASTPGVVAGIFRALIYHGLRLGLFPAVKRTLAALLAVGGAADVSLGAKMLIGACCGGIGAALCNPFDLVKARMAAAPQQHANSISAISAIARDEGGARALWRGYGATIARAALGSGAQLATYDQAKAQITKFLAGSAIPSSAAPSVTILLSTVVSAGAYVTAAAPMDLVKTRLMLSRGTGGKRAKVKGQEGTATQAAAAQQAVVYNGPLDCVRKSVQAEGVGVLFRGWGASFARLLPVLLLVFPLLESIRAAFGVGGF